MQTDQYIQSHNKEYIINIRIWIEVHCGRIGTSNITITRTIINIRIWIEVHCGRISAYIPSLLRTNKIVGAPCRSVPLATKLFSSMTKSTSIIKYRQQAERISLLPLRHVISGVSIISNCLDYLTF